MQRDIWGVFHDGVIAKIDGVAPGNLKIQLEIQYLRRMFDEAGDFFIVELQSCSRFAYSEYDAAPTESLSEIQELELEVLSVESVRPLVLLCVMGTLELEYESMKVLLPSGSEVSGAELASASERYWHEWSERTRRES